MSILFALLGMVGLFAATMSVDSVQEDDTPPDPLPPDDETSL